MIAHVHAKGRLPTPAFFRLPTTPGDSDSLFDRRSELFLAG